jgi:hypothetical protein
MLGAAIALTEAKAANHMAGEIVFFAVPAEEFIALVCFWSARPSAGRCCACSRSDPISAISTHPRRGGRDRVLVSATGPLH